MTGRLRVLLAMIVPLLAGGAIANDMVIMDGDAVAPFTLMIGDNGNWGIPVGPVLTESVNGYIKVENDPETGAKKATWNGRGEAQFFLAGPERIDLSAAAAADAALVMLLNVADAPRRSALLRMGCGHPCMANADIGRLLKALPEDQWLRVSVDLKCFVEGGLDIEQVETPFMLFGEQKMTVSVADVRLVDGLGPEATIKCR